MGRGVHRLEYYFVFFVNGVAGSRGLARLCGIYLARLSCRCVGRYGVRALVGCATFAALLPFHL